MRGAYRRVGPRMHVQTKAKGFATLQVLDENDCVVQEQSARNLILNGGLDGVRLRPWVDNFTHCVLGSNATPTSEASGATTASQSGTTVTLVGGTFAFTDTATDAGKTIRWNTTQQARIVSVTTPLIVEVDVTQAVPAGLFNVYNTQQTVAVMTEIQRGNGYVTAGGGCGSTLAGNILSHKRTFDFPLEVGTVTYREVAFSHSATPGDPIFSRIKLPTDLVLVVNQRVRVIYTLEITLTPDVIEATTANVVGWPVAPSVNTDGSQQLQLVALKIVDPATGQSEVDPANGISLEPSSEGIECAVFLSNSNAPLASFGASGDRSGTANFVKTDTDIDPATVTAGYGSLEKEVVLDVGEGNRTDWRTIGIGTEDAPIAATTTHGFVFVFAQDQTKDNLHTLELRFLFTWDRDLA